MSSKEEVKKLNEPDVFLSGSDHLFAWIEANRKSVSLVVLALVVLSFAWVGYGYIETSFENAAAEALFAPESGLKKAEEKVRDERNKKLQEATAKGAKPKESLDVEALRPIDFEKDFAPSVQAIKAQIQSHSKTKAALVSAMNLISFLVEQKQYGAALEVLSLPRYQPPSGDVLSGFWWMHKGLVLIENQKFDEAAKSYQSVLDAPALKAFHPEAMLKLGVAFELKGDSEQARKTYEKIGRDFPESTASATAQKYLRLLELKSQPG